MKYIKSFNESLRDKMSSKDFSDVNFDNMNTEDLLINSAEYGYLPGVIKAFNNGVEMDSTLDSELIHLAVENGHLNILKYLIEEQGFDKFFTKIGNDYILADVLIKGYTDILEYLFDNDYYDIKEYGRKLMKFAVKNGKLDAVKYFHNKGISGHMDREIRRAISKGYTDVVDYLESIGYNIPNVTESLRDKMTSMSLEEADKIIDDRIEKLRHVVEDPNADISFFFQVTFNLIDIAELFKQLIHNDIIDRVELLNLFIDNDVSEHNIKYLRKSRKPVMEYIFNNVIKNADKNELRDILTQ